MTLFLPWCKVPSGYDTVSVLHQQAYFDFYLDADTQVDREDRMGGRNQTDHDSRTQGLASLGTEKADLRRALNHKTSIFNGLPAGVMVIQKGRVLEANAVILHYLGYTEKEFLGRDFRDFLPPRLKTAFGGMTGRRHGGAADSEPYEIELVSKDGTSSTWDMRVGKIRANGRRAFLIMLIENEARKKSQRRLAEDLKARAIRTMASGMCRALTGIAGAIRGHAEPDGTDSEADSSKPGGIPETALKSLESMGMALECLARGGAACAEFTRFDLKKVVKGALAAGSTQGKTSKSEGNPEIKIKTYLRPVPTLEGNPDEIHQMLCHLVANALDAMPEGGHLFVSTEENAGYAYVYVQDSGVGIPPEIRESILDPFYTTKGSSGLGLSLCQAIVRRHRGEMEISSRINEGTMVTVRLPVVKAEDRERKRRPRRKSIKNARILIIEEDSLIGELLLHTLTSKGCSVTVAGSVAEGLLLAGKRAFDLVVVGSAVSDMKGESLVRRLKETKESLPVALIVDYANLEEMTAPADLMISKPIDMSQAIEGISEVVNREGITV